LTDKASRAAHYSWIVPGQGRRSPLSILTTTWLAWECSCVADAPHPLHPTDTRRQFWTQEAGIGRLVRDAPDGGQPKVDRGRRIFALFEVNPISKHDGAVEAGEEPLHRRR
jgi:hypothetical protein